MPVKKMLNVRKIFWIAAILTVIYVLLIYSRNNVQIDDRDRKNRLAKIDEAIKSDAATESCKLPDLPVNAPGMMKFVKDEPPIDCSSAEFNWVVVEGSECKLTDEAKLNYISITCTYTDLIRIDDYHSQEGMSTTITDAVYILKESDVVKVSCKSNTNNKIWQSILTGIRQDPTISENVGWKEGARDALHLNVLMFGFDSLSRNTFIRKLPKSYKYLTEVLDAQVLEGYNIVGDGTPQALIPILTGNTELELPDARRRIAGAGTVDVFPFVWKDFKEQGYVTAFLEDTPYIGTFTYRLNGFKDPPTDHYMRPYYLAAAPQWSHSPRLCYGATPRHKLMMDYIKNFLYVYKHKPKFLFGFHGELSHDSYNLIGVADNDLLNFLMDLNDGGYLKDTILIIMADHGHRFAAIRDTVQGKQEERLPFFSFVFPPSFRIEYKKAFENFKKNKKRLTTPFDIHATLKSVLSLGHTGVASLNERSLSLFSEIPEKRSCSDAYIEPHWCSCLDWHEISPDSLIIPKLVSTLLDTLNAYTSTHRNLCEVLHVKKVIWATELAPNDNLLRFKKNADIDGFVADLSSSMKIDSNLYQIKVQLEPGNSLFEASITHFIRTDTFDLKMSDISRINMYGKQARCIEKDYPHLRKYCYCKDGL